MPAKNRTVHITDNHIASFIPGDPSRCVLALAVKDTFPDADAVKVASGFISVSFGNTNWLYRIPRNPATYVAAVDAHLAVTLEPLSFRVSKPIIEIVKPVIVRKHGRGLPNTDQQKVGSDRANQQQSAAAKIRKALKTEYGSATRYFGVQV